MFAFVGVVKSSGGWLLGGSKEARSTPFIEEKNARLWATSCARVNQESGMDCYASVEVVYLRGLGEEVRSRKALSRPN